TVIFSTHVMEQAEQLCDEVMMIHKGKLAFSGTVAEVKRGRDRGITITFEGDGSVLENLPGKQRVNNQGRKAEVFLEKGEDPQQALRWMLDHLKVHSFDYREPSLHEVFVRTVAERDAAAAKTAGAEVS
ncbi:MAG: DUF4162 domain-containing protein, partial [Planctomycetes bacterium]|nr:DUF4162 domain-containing protein [Planctomycetota bacterium]